MSHDLALLNAIATIASSWAPPAVNAPPSGARFRAAISLLSSAARTLATVSSIPARARRRLVQKLRRGTTEIRRALGGIETPPDARRGLSFGPDRLPMATDPPRADLQWEMFESMMEGIDLRALSSELVRASEQGLPIETLNEIASELDVAASLLDVAAARTSVLALERADVSFVKLADDAVRACLDAARYRGVTVLVSTDDVRARVDEDVLGRALATLTRHAVVSMPLSGTLQLEVSGVDRASIELSFTGAFEDPKASSPLAGLEVAFFAEMITAHGGTFELSEQGGRTRVRFELDRAAFDGRCESLSPRARAA